MGKRILVADGPLLANDRAQPQHDIERALSPLDWEPRVLLDEALLPTIAYFKRQSAEFAPYDT